MSFPSRTLLIASFATAACDNPAPPPSTETSRISLGTQQTETVSISLLADEPLHVGLNRLYFEVRAAADDTALTSAALTYSPVMTMGSMMGAEHGAPHEQPGDLAVGGLFTAYVVFPMPTAEDDTWRIDVSHIDAGDVEEASFAVEVADRDNRRDLTLADGSTAMVTLDFDAPLHVGQNVFTVSVNQKADPAGKSWDAVEDLTLTAVPDMPSMGHGSPDNVAPTHVASGRYEGSVNLTMPGTWRIILGFTQDGTSLEPIEYLLEL